MHKKLHYGIIGCGMMGQEHIKNIHLLDNTEIAAIFEPNLDMRAKAKELAPNATFTQSIAELMAIQSLDCLLIASPNFLHCDQLEEISNIRHLPLLIEKPLYTDENDTDRLSKLIADYKAPIWVAMEYRYMPPVAKLIEEVDAATGGIQMLTIREHRFPFLPKIGDWNRFNDKTGGTLVEKCCHFFDLMRVIIKSEPVRVMASAGQSVNHLDEAYGNKTPDIWDNGYVIIDFKNGARAMLELCMFAEGSRFQEEITAIGSRGKIEARVPGPLRFWSETAGPPPVPEIIVSPRFPTGPVMREIPVDPKLLHAGDHNGSTYYQHEKFAAVVRGEQAIEVTANDGTIAVQMGMAAQRSALIGQAVDL